MTFPTIFNIGLFDSNRGGGPSTYFSMVNLCAVVPFLHDAFLHVGFHPFFLLMREMNSDDASDPGHFSGIPFFEFIKIRAIFTHVSKV
jgi:hypothetical protein